MSVHRVMGNDEQFRRMKGGFTRGTVPNEVVNLSFERGASSMAAWREHLGLTQAAISSRVLYLGGNLPVPEGQQLSSTRRVGHFGLTASTKTGRFRKSKQSGAATGRHSAQNARTGWGKFSGLMRDG